MITQELYNRYINNTTVDFVKNFGVIEFININDLQFIDIETSEKPTDDYYLQNTSSQQLYEDIITNGMRWLVLVKRNENGIPLILEGIHRVKSLKDNGYNGDICCFVFNSEIVTVLELINGKSSEDSKLQNSMSMEVLTDYKYPQEFRQEILFEESMLSLGYKIVDNGEFIKVRYDYSTLAIKDYCLYARYISNLAYQNGETITPSNVINDKIACKTFCEQNGIIFVETTA